MLLPVSLTAVRVQVATPSSGVLRFLGREGSKPGRQETTPVPPADSTAEGGKSGKDHSEQEADSGR